jgi:hypothetical protein
MDRRIKENALIEDVLSSQPLVAMPRSVKAEVMSRIQAGEAKRPALLAWSDFVLSLVLTFCIAALWFTITKLPPILVAKLRIQGILLYQDFLVNARWLIPALLFGMAAVLAGLTIPSLYRMMMDHRR